CPGFFLFPADAGMYRFGVIIPHSHTPVPRRRGDVPRRIMVDIRGAFLFPADAGMYRISVSFTAAFRAVPRRRGDVPNKTATADRKKACSPQTRGCTGT